MRPTFFAVCIVSLAAIPAGAQEAKNAPLSRQAEELIKAREWLKADLLLTPQLPALDKAAVDAATALEACRCRNQLVLVYGRLEKYLQARTLASQNAPMIQKFIQQYPQAHALRLEQARTYFYLGSCSHQADMFLEAHKYREAGVKLARHLADAVPNEGDYAKEAITYLIDLAGDCRALARYADGETCYQEAGQRARKLVKEFPKNPDYVLLQAQAVNSYALLVREAGRFSQAAELIREAIDLTRQLEKDHPEQPHYWRNLPTLCRNIAQPLGYLRNFAEAKAYNQEAIRYETKLTRFKDAGPVLTDEDIIIGTLQALDQQRLARQETEVEAIYQRALKKSQDYPDVPSHRTYVAMAKLIKGLRLAVIGLPKDQYEGLFQDSVAIFAKLQADNPGVPKYRRWHGEFLTMQGLIMLFTKNRPDCEELNKKGFAVLEGLAKDRPQEPKFRWALAEAQTRLTLAYMALNDLSDVVRWHKEGLAQMGQLAKDFPACPEFRRHHASGHITLGNFYLNDKRRPEAEEALSKGVKLWETMVAEFPQEKEWRKSLAESQHQLVSFFIMCERYDDADKVFPELIRSREQLIKDYPKVAECQADLGASWSWWAKMREIQKQHPQALAILHKAVECLDIAYRMNPKQRDLLDHQRYQLLERAELHQLLNQTKEHAADTQRARHLELWLEDPLLRLIRLRHQLTAGQVGPTLAEAEDMYHYVDLAAGQWHELAEIYACCAPALEGAAQKESAAARAVTCLRRALEEGHTSVVSARDNPNFQNLIQRADFQQLPKPR